MRRSAVTLLFLITCLLAFGQVHVPRLVIGRGEVYELKGSDILVVDTLIMMDSSRLLLNKLRPDNFLHARMAIFHRGAVIDGHGVAGLKGRDGKTGPTATTPCTNGKTGLIGTEGTRGGHGLNLFVYFSDIKVNGPFVIDVSGGDGADGGKGGPGGNGGQGTRLCQGGSGGTGGDGARGGDGGNGGSVTFDIHRIPELRTMVNNTFFVRSFGGNPGQGGEGGPGGYAGLSPSGESRMDGKPGKKGKRGTEGARGIPGAVNYTDK